MSAIAGMAAASVAHELESENVAYRARLATAENEIAAMRSALEPFAKEASTYDPTEGDDQQIAWCSDFTIGSLRLARSAYQGRSR